MKTTEQQHNERKREMMEKCFECYAENGLTGTGIKALADACGCTKANLYSYFKNFDYPEKPLKYKHIRRISD